VVRRASPKNFCVVCSERNRHLRSRCELSIGSDNVRPDCSAKLTTSAFRWKTDGGTCTCKNRDREDYSGKVGLRDWWEFMVCSWRRWGFLLPIFTSAITSPNRLLFAGVSTVLREPVPALTLYGKCRWDIEPHYNVLWTVRLCGVLRVEELER